MIAAAIQSLITLSAVLALALTQSRQARVRRWAPLVGLVGQPFWLYATFSWVTWGMFVCSVLYTLIWLYGTWVQWSRPQS